MTLLLLASAALADQCAWVDEQTASAARRFLPVGAVWVGLCEPCDERTPQVHVVGETRVGPTSSPRLYEVTIDGRPVDLAYVYVRATPDAKVLTNLARLVRCPTTGVSDTQPLPPPPALDLPVPSPCAQRTDGNGDGRWEFVQHYVYGPDRFLEAVLTDDGGDGRPDAVVRFTHDEAGRPLRATHDDDGDGAVDRVSDCRASHCTTNWVPQCPSGTDCAVGPLGLITEMRRGPSLTVNDYGCWSQQGGAWSYRRPADLPAVPGR
jgi:hypothetical protein